MNFLFVGGSSSGSRFDGIPPNTEFVRVSLPFAAATTEPDNLQQIGPVEIYTRRVVSFDGGSLVFYASRDLTTEAATDLVFGGFAAEDD